MEHYVQYHNPDLIKIPLEVVAEHEELAVGTNKKTKAMTGNRVWLIGGQGSPRKYYLVYNFIVDSVDEPADDHFRFTIAGKHGQRFVPPYEIGAEPWFYEFLRYMGHFSLGLRKIPDNYLDAFLRIAASAHDNDSKSPSTQTN